jgi:acetyl-CoA carboxylase carboxyl transferase subunit beta
MPPIWEGLKKFGVKRKEQPITTGDGPATKCEACGEILIKKTLDENLGVCPLCDHHHRITARRRAEIMMDEDTFEERYENFISKDILNFRALKTYGDKLDRYWKQTGEPSALLCGMGNMEGRRTAFAATDGFFCQGAMGSVVGEKFTRIVEDAISEKVPFVAVSSTGGGARMEESSISLMQMSKTCAALGRLRDAGLPFISIVTRFTMGGVWASWAAVGDIIIGEPKALIGFTGARVIKETIRKELPEGFQSSEFLLEHGQIDMIVERADMKSTVAKCLGYLCSGQDKTA